MGVDSCGVLRNWLVVIISKRTLHTWLRLPRRYIAMRSAQDGRSVVPALWSMVCGGAVLTWVACSYQALTPPPSGSGGGSPSSTTDSTGNAGTTGMGSGA